jgi:hypothetical protein
MKFAKIVKDLHMDDVTYVKFSEKSRNWLLSVSMDGTVCLNDFNQVDEDDALETRTSAPLNRRDPSRAAPRKMRLLWRPISERNVDAVLSEQRVFSQL